MKAPATIYRGKRLNPEDGTVSDISVTVNGYPLREAASLRLRNHSPTGFNWGYGGSGPAQLALGILLDYTGSEQTALSVYQDFKSHFVAGWGDEWEITGQQIEDWLFEDEAH